MAVSQKAKALAAAGHDVIDLGLGEPDFGTPDHIVEAAFAAAREGQTKYTPTGGTAALKSAVADKLRRENGLDHVPDEVIISNGAKQVIFDALMATVEPGQEVILLAPYFGSYKDTVLIMGGVPKELACSAENGFRLTPDMLEAAITPSTRWLFLNLPSNPAGAVYDTGQLRELGEVLNRHPQALVLSDEIYEHIIFDGREFVSFAAACPELHDRTLTVNGVSKAYAMTGWRIGYGAGPKALIAAMTTVQSQISSGACSVSQAAATAALSGPQDDVAKFREAFERRRDLVVNRVADMPLLTLDPPGGAFYAYVGCSAAIGATAPKGSVIENDQDFAEYLLNEGNVAVVPGNAFGLTPFFRMSTATSDEKLVQAMGRIAVCVSELTVPPK